MSEIQKLTDTIRNWSESDLCYGTLVTLKKIDHEAMRLEIALTEAQAEIERLRRFERYLKEEFLMNTQNYPKEYHDLFRKKFKTALLAAERGE